jgi:hypothetical protein
MPLRYAHVQALEWMLVQQSAPADTAAFIVEPILGAHTPTYATHAPPRHPPKHRATMPPLRISAPGEGGFVPPPPGFLAGLAAIARRHGILLIADEVSRRTCMSCCVCVEEAVVVCAVPQTAAFCPTSVHRSRQAQGARGCGGATNTGWVRLPEAEHDTRSRL